MHVQAVVAAVLISLGGSATAWADTRPRPRLPEVKVVAFAQGNCDAKVAKATARTLHRVIARCVDGAKGQADFTLGSSKAGKATKVKGRGTLPPPVVRCIEKHIETAAWPKASMCDIELSVTAK